MGRTSDSTRKAPAERIESLLAGEQSATPQPPDQDGKGTARRGNRVQKSRPRSGDGPEPGGDIQGGGLRDAGLRSERDGESNLTPVNEYGLTRKQELFCREYVVDMNSLQAWYRAGYEKGSDTTYDRQRSNELLNQAKIANRISILMNAGNIEKQISKDEYHTKILATYEAAMADADYTAANKSMELLGKSLGYMVEEKRTLNLSASLDGDKAQKVDTIRRLGALAGIKVDTDAGGSGS